MIRLLVLQLQKQVLTWEETCYTGCKQDRHVALPWFAKEMTSLNTKIHRLFFFWCYSLVVWRKSTLDTTNTRKMAWAGTALNTSFLRTDGWVQMLNTEQVLAECSEERVYRQSHCTHQTCHLTFPGCKGILSFPVCTCKVVC